MAYQSAHAPQAPSSGETIQEDIFVLQATGASFSKGDVGCARISTSTLSWESFSTPVSGDLTKGLFVVCLEDIAQNAFGRVLVRGRVDAFTLATAGTVTNGTLMAAATTKDLEADRATYGISAKLIARALFTGAVGGTRAIRAVLFDGLNGWGGIFGGAG